MTNLQLTEVPSYGSRLCVDHSPSFLALMAPVMGSLECVAGKMKVPTYGIVSNLFPEL